MAQYLRPHLLLFASLLVGVVVGVAGTFAFTPQSSVPDDMRGDIQDEENLREQDTDFKFISPLLSCGVESEFTTTKSALALRHSIEAVIQKRKDEHVITDAAVYVRELNDGIWFGIGETKTFTPGSLLKVPLAMSLLKKMTEDPTFAREPVEYTGGAPDFPQIFPPEKTAEAGKTYSFDELLKYSVMYSDNVSTLILSQLIDRETLNKAYSDLGIQTPSDGDSYTMTVRTYSSFFRILYNGTYLTHEYSEYLLSLLTQTTFNEGIVAGVPSGVTVAHKFGERLRDNEPVQLHDCGIVYAKSNPYIVCVMLRGDDVRTLSPVIADISRTVYEALAHK